MLEQLISVKGGEFMCSTCCQTFPAGTTAHTLFHIEIAKQRPADIDFAKMPNHEPETFVVILHTAPAIQHTRSQGKHIIITRKECDACHDKAKLATLRRNCFV